MYLSMEDALACCFGIVVARGVITQHARLCSCKIFEVFANPRLQEPSFVTLAAEQAPLFYMAHTVSLTHASPFVLSRKAGRTEIFARHALSDCLRMT